MEVVDTDTPRLLINREAVGPFDKGRWRRRSARDSVYLGDADTAARLLARELEWEEELDEMISQGHKDLKAKWVQQEKMYASGQKGKSKAAEEKEPAVAKEEVGGKKADGGKKGTEKGTRTVDNPAKDKVNAKEESGEAKGKDVDALTEAISKVDLGPKSKV